MLVYSVPQLLAALKASAAGAVITLAPGDWRLVTITGFQGAVTINGPGAVLYDLTIQYSSGLDLEGLELSTIGHAPGEWGAANTIGFYVLNSSNITLNGFKVHGAPNGTLATEISGLQVRASDHVTVSNGDFHNLHWAVEDVDDSYLQIIGNHFHDNMDDGLRGGGSSNVLVQGNACDSNHPDGGDTDHPDCIQFWSEAGVVPHDITITGNSYTRGAGLPTQGIFISDQIGNLPFVRLTIENNTITGAGYNGITVNDAAGLVMKNNIVCPYPDQQSWITLEVIAGGTLTDNQSTLYKILNSTSVLQAGDTSVATCQPDAGHAPAPAG